MNDQRKERIKELKAGIKGLDFWLKHAKPSRTTEYWRRQRAAMQRELDILTGGIILDPDMEEAPPYAENRRSKMRDAVEQAAACAENMYGKCSNPRSSMLPLITQMERGVLPKTYTLKKSDVGKLIDMFTFGRVRTFDVGKRIFLRQGIIQMESIQQMEKRKAKANPLIPAEFNIAIDMVSKHIDKARSLVGTDPHAAEEEAYQAIGILKAVEEAGKGLISISGEKKEIIRRLYGICQQIIGRADGAQGRPVPNPRYGFARRHYQLVAEIFANVGWGIGADARIAVTHALTLFIDAFTRDNPRFDTGKFINAAAPWMNKSQKEAVIAPFRR